MKRKIKYFGAGVLFLLCLAGCARKPDMEKKETKKMPNLSFEEIKKESREDQARFSRMGGWVILYASKDRMITTDSKYLVILTDSSGTWSCQRGIDLRKMGLDGLYGPEDTHVTFSGDGKRGFFYNRNQKKESWLMDFGKGKYTRYVGSDFTRFQKYEDVEKPILKDLSEEMLPKEWREKQESGLLASSAKVGAETLAATIEDQEDADDGRFHTSLYLYSKEEKTVKNIFKFYD